MSRYLSNYHPHDKLAHKHIGLNRHVRFAQDNQRWVCTLTAVKRVLYHIRNYHINCPIYMLEQCSKTKISRLPCESRVMPPWLTVKQQAMLAQCVISIRSPLMSSAEVSDPHMSGQPP